MLSPHTKDRKFERVPFSILEKEKSLTNMGLIVLETDLTIESEIQLFLSQKESTAKSIALMHTRIPCEDKVTAKNLSMMEKKFENSLKLFPKITAK